MWLKLAAIAPHAKTVNKKFFARILEVQFRILCSDNPPFFLVQVSITQFALYTLYASASLSSQIRDNYL